MSAVDYFDTQDVRPSYSSEAQTSQVLYFPRTYVAPPRVLVGLTSIDMKGGINQRIKAYADGIDREKFTAHIDSWADSVLYSASLNYLIAKPADMELQSGEFSTEEDHPSTNPQPGTSRRINFERPFITLPKVICFLKGWDMGGGSSSRLRTFATNIDNKGFTLHVETWADTTLYSAIAGWIAYPEDKEHIHSGSVSNTDVRPWPQFQQQVHERHIRFRGTSFWKTPTVFFALNTIDVGTKTNFRLKTYVDNVSTDGMTWHIDSWADTLFAAAAFSYIAFN